MKPYADPYRAGIALGLVLLASFVVMGRGLGASGAFASAAAGVTDAVAPGVARGSGYFSRYLGGEGPWGDWLLFELAGAVIGGFASARLAGRARVEVVRGSSIEATPRLLLAFAGGAAMGGGAMLARGCTSGLALTGGALLAAGSWLFVCVAFAAGFLAAPLMRRAWR